MIIDPIRTLSIELIHILTDISAWPMKTIQVNFPLHDVLNHLGQELCFKLFFFFGLICEAIVAFWIGFVRLLSHWCWDWEICLKWVDGKIVNVFWCPYFHPTFLTNLRWLDLVGRVKNILTFPFSLLFFSCETNRTSQIFHPPFHSNQTQYKI